MIHIAMIDDNVNDIKLMEEAMKAYPLFDIFSYTSLNDMLNRQREYDVLFLDIEMPEINGIDLAQKIKDMKDIPIIFVSSHSGYVFDTLHLRPFFFIRKNNLHEDLKKCIQLLDKELGHDEYLDFIYRYQKYSLNISEIVYVSINNRMTEIHMNTNEIIVCRITLKELLQTNGFENFCKINNDMIVNFRYVCNIQDFDCILLNGKKLDISYRNRKKVQNDFEEFKKRIEKK